MNVVGGNLITQGVYSVATPFHPFGGAVDIIVVEQQDGTYRSTPWYVQFGKFQGVLRGAEKIVRIFVNGVETNFHMLLDNSGEAYFLREVVPGSESAESYDQNSNNFNSFDGDNPDDIEDEHQNVCVETKEEIHHNKQSDGFQDMKLILESPSGSSTYNNYHFESFNEGEISVESSEESMSEMVLMSVDGQVITAPFSVEEDRTDNVQLTTPQFHLGPGEGLGEAFKDNGDAWAASLFWNIDSSGISECQYEGGEDAKRIVACESNKRNVEYIDIDRSAGITSGGISKDRDMFMSCIDLTAHIKGDNPHDACSPASEFGKKDESGHPQDIKFEEANAELGQSAPTPLQCSDFPCSANIKAVDIELKDLEDNFSSSSEQKNVLLMDFEEKSLDIENTIHEGSGAISVDSLSNELDISGPHNISEYGFEISLCGNLVQPGIGCTAAEEAFKAHRISEDEFKASGQEIIKNENLIVRYQEKYYSWNNIAHVIVGLAIFGSKLSTEPTNSIPVDSIEIAKDGIEPPETIPSTSSGRWRLWPIPFRRFRSLQHSNSNGPNNEVFLDSQSSFKSTYEEQTVNSSNNLSPKKNFIRTNMPTTEQIASLNLKDGQNKIVFSFSTRVLGTQQVDAHIYLWKWNAKIVISDVDGTITRSDVLGQVMPLVGKDWSQTGVARLFSAIKENEYQLLYLSARAIVQAYLTKNFLFNLKQDGKALPIGPVVISPDGLFPSLYREVIRRAPHEFKIACLQDIRALFPSDYNPFYAGFGNRDTDELSYRKIGIPQGKIFIINPKGEVALYNYTDVKSYTSLHSLVNDMFPPTSSSEQEDFNSWNYWKIPLTIVD